ncbi:Alpha-amylase/subtilisin inhibitor [Dichanthelium oligosanthes]|uniref:Alpha-amylase/subtilisin inhibitor n=1 Tax=Dichanthelium oligosanthes TaxID=888268 RepID=A0A1E5VNP4_9POAL|nr:Alpha-amylase/subtilisin inhibitor [Dichanthelium oligosanthes]
MDHHHPLLLLLLPLLAISFPCIAEDATQLVYDTENHELTSEESYYVLPAEQGTGGGLRMIHTWRPCNNLVSLARSRADAGTPVGFHPHINDSSGGKILLSTNVTIKFSIITACAETMYWSAGFLPLFSSEPLDRVAAGKDEGSIYPVPLPPEFVFRIERYDGTTTKGYKLVSCAGKGPCKDLGLYTSNENRWLAKSDSPFVVVFKKKQQI